jgi:hypothetical protein
MPESTDSGVKGINLIEGKIDTVEIPEFSIEWYKNEVNAGYLLWVMISCNKFFIEEDILKVKVKSSDGTLWEVPYPAERIRELTLPNRNFVKYLMFSRIPKDIAIKYITAICRSERYFINFRDSLRYAPLHYAVKSTNDNPEYIDFVKLFVELGADVTYKTRDHTNGSGHFFKGLTAADWVDKTKDTAVELYRYVGHPALNTELMGSNKPRPASLKPQSNPAYNNLEVYGKPRVTGFRSEPAELPLNMGSNPAGAELEVGVDDEVINKPHLDDKTLGGKRKPAPKKRRTVRRSQRRRQRRQQRRTRRHL